MTNYMCCPECDFKFALFYPKYQLLRGGLTNRTIYCPICKVKVKDFKERLIEPTPQCLEVSDP